MVKKAILPLFLVLCLFVAVGSAYGGADVIDLVGNEDETIDSFTILVDEAASYVFTLDNPPSHGMLSAFREPNNLTYMPHHNYNGPDTFAVKIRIIYDDPDVPPEDWLGVYNVTVMPINDIPVAQPLSVSTFRNTPVSVTLAGSDPVEGSSLTYAVWTLPQHGLLNDTSHGWITDECDQTIVYTPDSGFVGTDSFAYVVHDGSDYSHEAVVSITVTDSNILTVEFSDTGDGTVRSIPSGIFCVPGNSAGCSVSFTAGSTVELTQTASAGWEFSGWSGACSGTGKCEVTMDAPRTVKVNYVVRPAKVRIDGRSTPYYALGEAFDLIDTEGQTVRSRAEAFVENVVVTSPVTIKLKGGYVDDAFESRTDDSVSELEGFLDIRSGTLDIERLAIR